MKPANSPLALKHRDLCSYNQQQLKSRKWKSGPCPCSKGI